MTKGVPRNCNYCGSEYVPKSNNSLYCSGPHYMVCPVCGKEYPVTNNEKLSKPPTACSYACRKVLREKTSLERYGVTAPGNNPDARRKATETMMKKLGVPYAMMSDEVKDKSKRTCIEKYGVDNVSKSQDIKNRKHKTVVDRYGGVYPFNSDEAKAKQKSTMLERYGAECALACEEIRVKSQNTMIKRYGAKHMIQVPELRRKYRETIKQKYGVSSVLSNVKIRDRIKETWLDKYGEDNPMKSSEIREKAVEVRRQNNTPYEGSALQKHYTSTMMERYGVPYSCLLPSAQVGSAVSKTNLKFLEFLQDNGISISKSDMEFRIQGKSYDFRIPDTDTLIEVNPSYTHNLVGNHFNCDGLEGYYHLNKTRLAEQYGYRCIHVWDWDSWENIVCLIRHTEPIYARKCNIVILEDFKAVDSFLDCNHLQGRVRGTQLAIGLEYRGQLVQIMTFGQPRYSSKFDWELLRLCNSKDIRVVGGASKLFKFATNILELDNIISYCDRSKFGGSVYRAMGMKLDRTTTPNVIWSKGKDRITSNLLRLRGFDQLFNTSYGKGTDNEKLMIQEGWLPVCDCGQFVFSYRKGTHD